MANDYKFQDFSKEVKRRMNFASEKSMETALLFVEGQAKILAPVGEGELRDHISHKINKKSDGDVSGQVGSPSKHAFYVEYGTGEFAKNGAGRKGGWVYKAENGKFYYTKGQKPQPFLVPAFRRNRSKIVDIIGKSYGTEFN